MALCLAACGVRTDPDDMPIAPWHMWGKSEVVDLTATASPFDLVNPQLAKVAYGRPETWTFFFWARILESSNAGGAGVVQVRYNLTIGVGRDSYTIPDFVTFVWTPTLPIVGQRLWTTRTTDPTNQVLSEFPAQDIQLNTNCIITGGAAPGDHVRLEVGAFLSPRNHIRPEWYRGEFPGGEDAGK